MSFGTAKMISRRMAIVKDYQVLVLDLSEVPTIGITAALAVETMVRDAVKRDRHVWIVVTPGQVQQRIEKLQLHRFSNANRRTPGTIPGEPSSQIHQVESRSQALQSSFALIPPEAAACPTLIDS